MVNVVADEIIELYLTGEFDKVYLSYTYFASAVKQEVIFDEFIPIKTPEDVEYIDYLCEPDTDGNC